MAFKPMTVADIKAKMDREYEVELSGFDAEDPNDSFPCIIKSVPLTEWMFHGKVPNELAGVVEELFDARQKGDSKKVEKMAESAESLKGYISTLEWIARESLVSPSYQELEDAGIYLSSMQLNEIYLFQTQGVSALKTFRDVVRDASARVDGEEVREAAVGDAGDK